MDGIGFEKYCCQYLHTRGYSKITMTQASNDQGIDILATKQGLKYGFQCKFYSHPVGNDAVQQAYTGAAFYDCDVAGVITNNTFTKSAIKLAEQTDVMLMDEITPSSTFNIGLIEATAIFFGFIAIFILHDCSELKMTPLILSKIYSCFALLFGCFLSCLANTFLWSKLFTAIAYICFLFLYYPVLIQSDSNQIQLVFWFICFLLFCSYAIRFLFQAKDTYEVYARSKVETLHEEMNTSVQQMGQSLKILLEDELGIKLTLKNATHTRHKDVFTFQSTKNIIDGLALAEYSLNQYAAASGMKDRYRLLSKTNRSFEMIVTSNPNMDN